jgi:hypothetical protein
LSRCRINSFGSRSMLTRCATTCFELSVAAASAAGAGDALDPAFALEVVEGVLVAAVFEPDAAGGGTIFAAACGAGANVGDVGAPAGADVACGAGYRATSLS